MSVIRVWRLRKSHGFISWMRERNRWTGAPRFNASAMNCRLCTTICKNGRSVRVSGNAHFGLVQLPTTTFAPKWAEFRVRCGNGARWDLKRNLCRRLLPVPPSLETRTKRGFPHCHSEDDGELLTATNAQPHYNRWLLQIPAQNLFCLAYGYLDLGCPPIFSKTPKISHSTPFLRVFRWPRPAPRSLRHSSWDGDDV